MKLHHLTAMAAATLFAGALGAQTPPIGQPTQPVTPTTGATGSSSSGELGGGFTTVDKDSDGSISKKEAASNRDLTKKWDTLDANKDGKLDQGEFAQFEASGSMSGDEGGASGSASGSTSEDGAKTEGDAKADKPKY